MARVGEGTEVQLLLRSLTVFHGRFNARRGELLG